MKTKKKHTGLKVLLGILIFLLALAAAVWCYLRFSDFSAERGAAPAKRGVPVLYDDGSADLTLNSEDLRWVYDAYFAEETEEALTQLQPLQIERTELALQNGEAVVYADLSLYGLVSAHVKASGTLTAQDDMAVFEPVTAWLGGLIRLPAEKLRRFGLQERYSLDLDGRFGCTVQSMALDGDTAAATVTDFGYEEAVRLLQPSALVTARLLDLLGGDAGDCAPMVQQLTGGAAVSDATEALRELMSLADAETVERALSKRSEFVQRFVLPDPELSTERLHEQELSCRARYEQLLTRAEEAWCGLCWKVCPDGFADLATGELVSVRDLDEAVCLNGDDGAFYLMYTYRGTWPVRVVGMPAMRNVTFADDSLRGNIPDFSLGFGVALTLPNGRQALLYHLANGQFVVHLVERAELQELAAEYGLPFVLDDSLPKPHTRPAPRSAEGDCSELMILEA